MKYAGSTLVQKIGDIVEYLIAVALIGAPLIGLLALMVISLMDNQERAAFVAWEHRDLFLIIVCSLPFLINVPNFRRFIRERHLLRREISKVARLKAGQALTTAAIEGLRISTRAKSLVKSTAIIWTPACALGILALMGGAIVHAWPIDAVKGIVGTLFLLIWLVFVVWVFVGWGAYAHEPENEHEAMTVKPRPHSPAAAPNQRPIPQSSDQAIRILARSIYRELKNNGYSREQVIAIAAELIELTVKEMEPPRVSAS